MLNDLKNLTIIKRKFIIKTLVSRRWILMKRTYQPNNRKKAKKHGFFARKETNILKNRRRKGRKVLSK